ncbi:PASTA domain-containing protein [candidate division WOR-3 bacterium]|nr:PASTA domain-containing protein [candidate division WOR-3 bacterium]
MQSWVSIVIAILALIAVIPSAIVAILTLRGKIPLTRPEPEPIMSKTREKKPRKRKWFLAISITITAVAIAALIFALVMLSRPKTPEIVGETEEKARSTLSELGIKMSVVDSVWSEEIPEGCIVTQNPNQGTILKKGEEVKIWISKGIQMPEFKGIARDSVLDLLTAYGVYPKIDSTFTDEVTKGQVLSTNPPAGVKVPVGESVTVTVSIGRVTCPSCGRIVAPDWTYCEFCKAKINPE